MAASNIRRRRIFATHGTDKRTTVHVIASLLLLFQLFSTSASAGGQPSPTPHPPPSNAYDTRFQPSMVLIILVIVALFLFLVCFPLYIRQCGERLASTPTSTGAVRSWRRSGRRGLDQVAIESFPTLVYSDVKNLKIGKRTLECAVCISEFEDEETLRLLPKCSHAFHPECIDMWLASHTTCPVCRANLVPDPNAPLQSPPPLDALSPQVEIVVQEDEVEGDPWGFGGRRAPMPPWRSKSASPALGAMVGEQNWAEDDQERFTLRLPDGVRREVMAGRLGRSLSAASCPASGRGRWDLPGRSSRWPFLSRTISVKIPKVGGGGGGTRVEGPGVAESEASTRPLARSP